MNAQELITAMEAKGYWTSPGGKTPHATVYSAILRDLAKGDDSKFVKAERGRLKVQWTGTVILFHILPCREF